MPVYIRRTLTQFPIEFYRCGTNPEGYGFRCPFCDDFFKTKAGRSSHMKHCSVEETGEEFDEENMLCDDITVGDCLRGYEIIAKVIRKFIQSNELEGLAEQTSEQIQAYIRNQLIENGYASDSINNNAFLIYRFFFEVTDEVWETAKRAFAREISEKLFGLEDDEDE